MAWKRKLPTIQSYNRNYVAERVIIYLLDAQLFLSLSFRFARLLSFSVGVWKWTKVGPVEIKNVTPPSARVASSRG